MWTFCNARNIKQGGIAQLLHALNFSHNLLVTGISNHNLTILLPVSEAEGDSKANLTDDIGYDDISDDELDDLITGAEDEREEKQSDKMGE